jgi:hypothetical protein
MPPPPRHGPRDRRHVPSSRISAFIDPARIEALLEPWIPAREDREFVVRCVLGEGPAHHRGANFVLLSLLGLLLDGEAPKGAARGEGLAVPMHLPPHLAEENDEAEYPLRLPTSAVAHLAPEGSDRFAAMVDCLTDGPPQHALANVAMVCLITEILERRRGPER